MLGKPKNKGLGFLVERRNSRARRAAPRAHDSLGKAHDLGREFEPPTDSSREHADRQITSRFLNEAIQDRAVHDGPDRSAGEALLVGVEIPIQVAERPFRSVFPGVRVPSRVEPLVHLPDRAGALVPPRKLVSRRRSGGAATTLGLGLRDLAHAAPATPAVGRKVIVPPRMIHREQRSGPESVPVAVFLPGPDFIHEVGMALLRPLGSIPGAGRVGRTEVCPVDRAEAAVAAESNPLPLAGQRVVHLPPAPPAALLQYRCEFCLEAAEGPALAERAVDCSADFLSRPISMAFATVKNRACSSGRTSR